jgi:hypothetical protein
MHNRQLFSASTVDMEEALRKKYFGRVQQQQYKIPLSSEILTSMLTEACRINDAKTIAVLVKQLLYSNGSADSANNNQLLGEAVMYYINSRDSIAAANVIRRCDPQIVRISEELCSILMSDLVSNFKWDHAFLMSMYMIMCDYKIPDKSIFFLTGGLMRKSDGAVKVLELIKLIAIKRRSDLTGYFSYNKVNRFAMSLGGSINSSMHSSGQQQQPLEAQAVKEAMTAVLHCLRGGSNIDTSTNIPRNLAPHNHWFSFSLSKFLVAIACAGDHRDIAADFITLSVNEVAALQKRYKTSAYIGHGHESLDVPTLLRAYAQADAVDKQKVSMKRHLDKAPPQDSVSASVMGSRQQQHHGVAGSTAGVAAVGQAAEDLSVLLLQLTVKHGDLIFNMGLHNKRLCMDVVSACTGEV